MSIAETFAEKFKTFVIVFFVLFIYLGVHIELEKYTHKSVIELKQFLNFN